MGTFAEQLSAARKEAHMTQDQLADQVHVTRAAVSHWENGRYLPDFDMIRKLSEVLNVRFDMDACADAETEKQENVQSPDVLDQPEAGNEPGSAADQPGKAKKWFPWIIAAVVLAAAVFILVSVFSSRQAGTPDEVVSSVDSTTRYRISDYKAAAPREEGKAYLTIDTESRVEHGDGNDFWMYTFLFREDNGVQFHIDEVELVNFFTDRAHPRHFTPDELGAAGIGPDMETGITYPFVGGCPLDQADMTGVGIKVTGTDGNDVRLFFTGYIPFPKQ